MSIPRRIMLYVFMGSAPEKGGLEAKEENCVNNLDELVRNWRHFNFPKNGTL